MACASVKTEDVERSVIINSIMVMDLRVIESALNNPSALRVTGPITKTALPGILIGRKTHKRAINTKSTRRLLTTNLKFNLANNINEIAIIKLTVITMSLLDRAIANTRGRARQIFIRGSIV